MEDKELGHCESSCLFSISQGMQLDREIKKKFMHKVITIILAGLVSLSLVNCDSSSKKGGAPCAGGGSKNSKGFMDTLLGESSKNKGLPLEGCAAAYLALTNRPSVTLLDIDGNGVTDAALVPSGDGRLNSADLNFDGIGDIAVIDSTGAGTGNIAGVDTNSDGFIDIYRNPQTPFLTTGANGTGATVSFLDTNADGFKDSFDIDGDGKADVSFLLQGIDLNGDGKADANILDTNGDGIGDAIDLDRDGRGDFAYIDTNGDGKPDAFDLNGDGTAEIFYNTGISPLLSTGTGGTGSRATAFDKNNDGRFEGFDIDGNGAIIDYALGGIDLDGNGTLDGILIDTNMDGKKDSIDVSGDGIGDIAFLDTNNDGIPEALDTNLDGKPDLYFSKSTTPKLSTAIGGTGSEVTIIDTNSDGYPDGFDTNKDGTSDITIHTKGVPFKVGDTIDLDADGRTEGTLVDSDGDGKVDGIDVNGDGRRDIVYSDSDKDGKYDSLDTDGDGVNDVNHYPGQAPVLDGVSRPISNPPKTAGQRLVPIYDSTPILVGFGSPSTNPKMERTVVITSSATAPTGIKYDPPGLTLTKGTAMTAVRPTVPSGVTVTSYAISPALPAGLTFNTTTGEISGTPTGTQVNTVYTITATGTGGTTRTHITIGTNSTEAPTSFAYSPLTATGTVGTPITVFTPTIAGTVENCTVSPALPIGLTLNRNTCVISGTPLYKSDAREYTITAKGTGGTITAKVTIGVNASTLTGTGTGTETIAAPTVSITGSPFTYMNGTAITNITPTVTGTVTSCTTNPTLPAGLTINATTCVISGTPTADSVATNYTVTATNATGSNTATISITVNPAAPSALTFTGSPFTYSQGTAITTLTPTITGTVTTCTVTPTLPAGLTINNTTCAISGTPTTGSLATTYTITASNVTGNKTATISIAVIPTGSTKLLGVDATSTVNGKVATVDSSGNVYVAGYTDTVIPTGNTQSGNNDLFVVKYDLNGTRQWVKHFGAGAGSDADVYAIKNDSAGNVYVAGKITSGTFTGATRGSTGGGTDSYVLKIDPAGTLTWARQLGGGTNTTLAVSMTLDSSGNVYITGDSNATLDAIAPTGTRDLFVAKYDSSGTKQGNITRLGVAGATTLGTGIAVDSSSNLYVTGYTAGNLDGVTKTGTNDIFLVKYNSSLAKQGTATLLGTAAVDARAYGITIDSSANVYIVGETSGTFDGVAKTGSKDSFLVKYNSSLAKQGTATLLGVAGVDTIGRAITIDSSSNIFIAGDTAGNLDGKTKTGTKDTFVTRYNTSLVKQGTLLLGGAGATVLPYSIAMTNFGKTCVAGNTTAAIASQTYSGGNADLFFSTSLNP